MTVGDFRSPDLDYKGWIEVVSESNKIGINKPSPQAVFFVPLGASKKEITVSGFARGAKGKILIVIRTDRDYPQALVTPKQGKWKATGCTLGGVDHLIYAVLVDGKDKPIIRSRVVKVRLERGG